ncbi:hypothetical protein JCGZ_20466 [Jatropha curcas]|uniref:Uncharacterized protein n=1 Tax=Jatropha curcas TaxID=180498 RepID=A0A067JZ88_JATCU|nr:hypothetical protein JCGZ_20466 [Jatropha curcas]
MARNLAVTFAATALLFLLIFADAHSPLDPPANDVVTESDPKAAATIILPSEKPNTEPEETEAVNKRGVELEPIKERPESERTETESEVVPLTVLSFRPINRLPLIRFRRGHRCRGRRRHINKPWGGPRFDGPQEISYGKDMILSGDEDLGFDRMSLGRARPIPMRWTRFNHGGHRFSLINDEQRGEGIHDRPHHPNHHHDEELEEKRHEHEHEHEHHGYHPHDEELEEESHDHEELEEKRHYHEHDHDHHRYRHHDEELEEERHGHGHGHGHRHGHRHEHDGGFLKGIRKFLEHF